MTGGSRARSGLVGSNATVGRIQRYVGGMQRQRCSWGSKGMSPLGRVDQGREAGLWAGAGFRVAKGRGSGTKDWTRLDDSGIEQRESLVEVVELNGASECERLMDIKKPRYPKVSGRVQ